MTREEAKKLLPIIKAFSEGKEIEGIYKGIKSPWFKVEDIVFDGGTKYRIKPEPAYRPFKDAEECWTEMQKHQPFGWVVDRKSGVMYLLRSLTGTSVYTSIQYLFRDAFDKLVFADLVPFGVKEEE